MAASMAISEAPIALRLPFSPQSVAVARQRLQAWMLERGDPPELVEDARLVVSELVANAVRHASPLADGTILVQWCIDAEGVELTVTDGGGTTRPQNMHAASTALGGRGMAIVDVLAQSWWTDVATSRSTVHAVLRSGVAA